MDEKDIERSAADAALHDNDMDFKEKFGDSTDTDTDRASTRSQPQQRRRQSTSRAELRRTPSAGSASATSTLTDAGDRRTGRPDGRETGGESSDDTVTGTDEQPALPEKDPFEVGWDDNDVEKDPWCPRAMPFWRKWVIVVITCCGGFCVTCASSIYTSTYDQMNKEFEVSDIVATLGLSTFVLGISLGPAWSPLSEFYGRRPIYLVSFFLFMVWLVPSAVARNIQTMVIARFFQGFTGSAFLSVAGGTVGDLFGRDEMHAAMSLFTLAPFIGPSMGPIIGGFINSFANWRWTYYVLIMWSFGQLMALALFVPETYHPAVLRNKARKIRKDTGDDRWKAPIEKMNKSVVKTVGYALLRPFQLLIWEPMCLSLDLYAAILLGVLYLFFGAFPLVFEHNHGFNLWQVGLSFTGLLVGMVLGGVSFPVWHHIRMGMIHKKERETGIKGASEPEYRLPQLMLGAILVPIGLFWFGWTTYSSVHWIVPIIGSAVFAIGTFLAFSGIFTFLVEAYPLYAASALAANAFLRCMFAAAFPLFGVQMYDKLDYQWATSLLAFLTVAMLPFPFIFFKYGKRIRGHSRFASNN